MSDQSNSPSQAAAPAVVVSGVGKRFRLFSERNQTLKSAIMRKRVSAHRDFWAVRGASFEVPAGSTFGLVGSNGSGKSTLLKCLAKILVPNEGTIEYNGRLAALLEVGSGFHPELSGRENVYLNGSILGMSRKEVDAKFDAIVDFSGIGAFIDEPVKNYSSGMYVRLGFSVAIHVEPDILVVDEILAVGDAAFQAKCRDKFRELRESGKTVILVSHSLDLVADMCDHAAWLEKGELKQVGPVEEIIEAYSFGALGVPDQYAGYIEEANTGPRPLGWPVTVPAMLERGRIAQGFSNAAVVWTPEHGAVTLAAPIQDAYEDYGGLNGWLGWPTTEMHLTERGTHVQHFEHGVLECFPDGTSTSSPLD